jgi:Na+/proline symporter
LALALGALIGFGSTMLGMFTGNFALSIGAGVLPGIAGIFLSRRMRRNGFAQGVLVGACLVILLGGLCGGLGAALHDT